MIDTTNIQEARVLLQKEKGRRIVRAQDSAFNRSILEQGKAEVLLSPERMQSDSLRSIGSGVNHVLAKIATKNKIALGIDLIELRQLSVQKKAQRLARIRDIISTCRRAGTRLAVHGASDTMSKTSLLRALGASSQQASEALAF
ncbi:hypothetical protein HYZ97_04565 [Candidatus Pacearchaeota archaeon]|nr:hypothetical protein [Candidatus Pacearchaeota archaeon]